jgi:hypothetical protein
MGIETGAGARRPPVVRVPGAQALALSSGVGSFVGSLQQKTREAAGISQEQGALFGPLEEPCRSRTRFPQPTEGRAEGEAEEVGGP